MTDQREIMAAPGDHIARDLLRTFILRTNPYFPFRSWNRWPYSWAVRVARGEFGNRPEIRGLYLRHGMARDGWIPGLSDIDLSVILKAGLPEEQEFPIVDSLRARHRRLKRAFPMLGEIEILAEDDLPAWLYWTSDCPGNREWTLLEGQGSDHVTAAGSPVWRRRALHLALWVYLELLPPCVSKPDSFLRFNDAARRVNKIVRQLHPILREDGHPATEIETPADVPALIGRAATALASAVSRVEPAMDIRNCGTDTSLSQELVGVRSGILHDGRVILVMNNDLDGAALAKVTKQARERWTEPVVLLPENVFRYFVCHYNPYLYGKLAGDRNILLGGDPFDGVPPPGRAEFVASTLDWVGHILAFARGAELFSSPGKHFLGDFETEIRRMMALQLLLEDDWISPDRDGIEARWRHRFPDSAQVVARIRTDAAAGRKTATRTAFTLFRDLAAEIREPVAARQ